MDVIRYTTTLKASGTEYKKIVFWNRFLRNKLELILTFIPALLSIILFCFGFYHTFFLIAYLIVCCYPLFIFRQFKSTVEYHLKHRDPSENAPCEITFMENGILAEINEFDLKYIYHWDEFTTIYDKYGYYMMFQKGKMIVMLRKADIPAEFQQPVIQFMRDNVNQNECMFRF